MTHKWEWKDFEVAWQIEDSSIQNSPIATVLIHGFGACKEHWRHNQKVLGSVATCYSIDLIGFGESSQPKSQLIDDYDESNYIYCFDNWAQQIAIFCKDIVKKKVVLIGNSIGGVIALKSAELLGKNCSGVVLINCAQRRMDDKRLSEKVIGLNLTRPILKKLIKQRWLSNLIFKNVAKPFFIKKVLKIAYPTGNNIDKSLIEILYKPTKRLGASESFRGFINLFNDYLAPNIMQNLEIPVDMIWGEMDPWEALEEAKQWHASINCVRSLEVIPGCGHCPHDEQPNLVNPLLLKIIQQAI